MHHPVQPLKKTSLQTPTSSHSAHWHPVRWYPADRWLRYAIPASWRDWLVDNGSLTKRLIAASAGNFSVRVLRQDYHRPAVNEARALGLAAGRYALIREVVLMGNNKPWVYARSILPLETLTGRLRALRKLDNRPLGALLFADKTLSRGDIEIARIPGLLLPQNLAADSDELWGRRSLFYLDNKPLLVSEIFLPDFNPYNTRYNVET